MAYGPMSTPRRPAPRSIGTPMMPTSRTPLAAGRMLACVIVVEASTSFTSQVACRDHLAQQGRSREARLLELVEQDVGNVQRCVQPDEVEQGERAHRVARAEHHADVDVFSRREALLEHPHGLAEIRDQPEVDDESRAILADDDALAQALAEASGPLERFVRSGERADVF